MLKCDMCHKPLKEGRFKLVPFMRPDLALTVGPDCFRKAKKAEKELRDRKTPDEIAALRVTIAKRLNAPKFENVSCSHCGKSFGPGDHGFSHCDSHAGLRHTIQ